MPSLTTYGTAVPATTIATAGQIATSTGGTSATNTTLVGTAQNYGEVYALGTSGAWAASFSIGSPSGNGWLLDSAVLESNTFPSGNWTPTVRLFTSANTCSADIHFRLYRYNTGTYTLLNEFILTGQSFSTAHTNYTLPTASLPTLSFGIGDKLYLDLWLNITASTMTSGNTITLDTSSTSLGLANCTQVVTPGYIPSPSGFTLFGVDHTDANAVNASSLVTDSTGTSVSGKNTPLGLATGFGEVLALGSGSAPWAGLNTIGAPSGNGWVYDTTIPNGVAVPALIPAGAWSPIFQLRTTLGSLVADLHLRAFKITAEGAYVQIGNDMVLAAQTLTTTPNFYVWGSITLPPMNFYYPGDCAYVDLWANVTSNSTGSSSSTITSYIGSSSTQGNLGTAQISLPGFVPGPNPPNPTNFYGIFQFVGQDTNVPGYPTPPWTTYIPTSNTGATNPYVVGASLIYTWAMIEPSEGTYNWSLIDNDLNLWAARGKYVILRIQTAVVASQNSNARYNNTASQATPQWVFDAGCTKLTEADTTVFPVYWDSVYQAKFTAFITAFGARYNAHLAVYAIQMGIGDFGETDVDSTSASTSAKIALWCNGGTVNGPNTPFTNGTPAYTNAQWAAYIQWAITLYKSAFPNTPLLLLPVSGSFLTNDSTYNKKYVTELAVSHTLWMQDDSLSKNTVYWNDSNWQVIFHIAEQGRRTSQSGDTLAQDLQQTLAVQASLALIFTSDITAPSYASTMAQYAALATPLPPFPSPAPVPVRIVSLTMKARDGQGTSAKTRDGMLVMKERGG